MSDTVPRLSDPGLPEHVHRKADSDPSAAKKAANKAAMGSTVPEVRNLFDKQSAVDDFKSVTGKDLEVTKEGDKIVVSFAYQREIHLAGPAYLVLKYAGRSK